MSKQIQIPDIGGDEVTVTEVMIKVGDTVAVEQSVINVEGDKASMEVPSPEAGVIKEILVNVGDKVSTGTPMFTLDTTDVLALTENIKIENLPIELNTASSIIDIQVPDIGGDEVNVTEILVKIGDKVVEEQSIINVEGDKAAMEVPAPQAGTVKEILINIGDKVSTGSLIMRFEVLGNLGESLITQSPITLPTATSTVTDEIPVNQDTTMAIGLSFAHATPVVRRLAREFGVNLDKVKGTGRKGRILKEDVQNYVKTVIQALENNSARATSTNGTDLGLLPWPKVDFSKFGEIEEIELSRIQKISGANLHRNWVMIPHVTQWDKADITNLEAFRKEQNILAEKQKLDVKITPLVFIMKAVAKALEVYPRFNSSLSEDNQSLIMKKYINIGVAVDTPNGLVVPVFRDVNKKTIIELSRELAEVSKKARAGKLTASDMQGGCFTISSLGGIGGTHFTPIVNAPEVAILGVSKSEMTPVWNTKEFIPRLMLPLSLSYDHRVIDGADGARFITFINGVLSDIRRLIM